jgi:hypothetical protein
MARFTLWGPAGLMTIVAADEKDALERVIRGEGEAVQPLPRVPTGPFLLRDYFAAAVLPALVMKVGGDPLAQPAMDAEPYGQSMSRRAYGWADAMLAERAKKNVP